MTVLYGAVWGGVKGCVGLWVCVSGVVGVCVGGCKWLWGAVSMCVRLLYGSGVGG